MKRKLLSIVMASAMTLSLVACGGGSASTTQEAPAEASTEEKAEEPAAEEKTEEPAAETIEDGGGKVLRVEGECWDA